MDDVVRDVLDGASMITADAERGEALVLIREVALDRPANSLRAARLRATAHGIYEVRVNGQCASDAVLAPGWTTYEHRLQVQTYDVTHLIQDCSTLEVLLGNGWWRGDLGFAGAELNYGHHIGFIAELVLSFEDGHSQVVVTDESWTATTSSTTANNLYQGQRIDARSEQAPGQLTVTTVEFDRNTLVEQVAPDVTRHETVAPARIWDSPAGKVLVDFGQNLVGWIRLRVQADRGTEIHVRHAEVLDDGELGVRPLRLAAATDTFVCSGNADEFEPTLTFHGFRYAELTGLPAALQPDQIEAVVVHSALVPTGEFECSSELVNQLVKNVVWSLRGNFLSIPTDCPQRDERLGWTGDIAAFAPTACFQFDVSDFLHSWLLDLRAEALDADGSVPIVVPNLFKLGKPAVGQEQFELGATAIWGDAAVWVPEALWAAYGDLDRLAEHYPGMVLHLESVLGRLSERGLWETGFQFGDWLDPDAPPDNPAGAKADSAVVATACLYRSASFAAAAAAALGLTNDERRWGGLAQQTKAAFNQHYVTADGTVRSDCATVYALAIHFGLLEGDVRAAAGARLRDLVRERDHTISTGFAGTPYVTWALTSTGHVEDAYKLLLQTTCPSWLYPVTMGATTVWERWDSMLQDGSINPGEMTSFNHYALGAVADWLYQVVVGIRPAEPGYRRVRLQPVPGPGLEWARASLRTGYGEVRCAWKRQGAEVRVDVVVPHAIEADVVLPDGSTRLVTGGSHSFRYVEGHSTA